MFNLVGFGVLCLRLNGVELLFVTIMFFVSQESAGEWRWVFRGGGGWEFCCWECRKVKKMEGSSMMGSLWK